MTVTAVFGVHWGDEGKGKVIDALLEHERYNIVARWNGGDNAGHTVVTDEFGKVALHLTPSGILHKNTINVIGNGVVVNLQSLVDEINGLREKGIVVTPDRLVLSDRAHLILPHYLDVEKRKEVTRKIGTTGRAIGIAYTLKPDRIGVRVCDLLDSGSYFKDQIAKNVEENGLNLNPETVLEHQRALLKKLLEYLRIENTVYFFQRNSGADILLEGAQGVLLDVDAGTYPYVTSSNASPAGAYTGLLGIPRIDRLIGVMKGAYITRVGGGPFPTALITEDEIDEVAEDIKRSDWEELTSNDLIGTKQGDRLSIAKYLRVKGHEYGTTTGRPRRTGWQDLVATKYALAVAGVGTNQADVELALTKLDVGDSLPEINICLSYKRGGVESEEFPSSISLLEEVDPIYEKQKGWEKPTNGVTRYRALPSMTRMLIDFLEDDLNVPVRIISNGPSRREIIYKN